jgi:hypothetical protein
MTNDKIPMVDAAHRAALQMIWMRGEGRATAIGHWSFVIGH